MIIDIETVATLVIGDSGNVFLDGKGPNTQIETVAGSSTESSINYETSLVTDTADRDMYFSKIVYYQLEKLPSSTQTSTSTKLKLELRLALFSNNPATHPATP